MESKDLTLLVFFTLPWQQLLQACHKAHCSCWEWSWWETYTTWCWATVLVGGPQKSPAERIPLSGGDEPGGEGREGSLGSGSGLGKVWGQQQKLMPNPIPLFQVSEHYTGPLGSVPVNCWHESKHTRRGCWVWGSA